MATVTKPIALDESINTTENPSRNIADVLAQELSNIAQSIGAINQKYKIVQTLPDTDISTTAIYLVPKSTAQTDNTYDEYINLTGTSLGWEKIGDTEIDLSDYYTESEVDALLAEKADVSDIPVLPTADEQTSTTGEFETVTGGLLNECEIELDPVQDLNGYDHPWVGGLGKNLLNPSLLSFQSSGYVWTNNYSTIGTIPVSPSTNYVLSFKEGLGDGRIYQFDSDGNQVGSTISFNSTAISFSTESNCAKMSFRFKVFDNVLPTVDTSEPMLELGSSATSYEPYENICPISGHTQADVTVFGKNRLDISSYVLKPWNGNEENTTRARGEHAIPTKVGVTYTVSVSNAFLSNYVYAVVQMDSDFPATTLSGDSSWRSTNSYTFTSLTEHFGINVRRIDSGAIDLNDLKQMQVQVELGSTATEYMSYNKSSKIYSTPFGSTYYGGTIDLVSGELVIEKKYLDLGQYNWNVANTNTSGKYRMLLTLSTDYAKAVSGEEISNAICDVFKTISAGQTYRTVNGVSVNGSQIIIYDERFNTASSASEFKTAMSGHSVVYELATPTTIQLTPQQIVSLVGKNYVDAPLDGQSIVEVKFKQLMTIDDVLALIGG